MRFINIDQVGDDREDLETDSVAVLTENTGDSLTSVLTFNTLQASVHNNTIVECSTLDDDSINSTITMAGTYISSTVNYTV